MSVPYAQTDTFVASAARTTSSNSGILSGWGAAKTLRLQLNVTAVSGTNPTLDVLVEDTLDGTNWNTLVTFTQATGATREVKNLTTQFAPQIRVSWTIGGTATPTFTFSVVACATWT